MSTLRIAVALSLLVAPATAQQNSQLPRADVQLSAVQGVIQDATGNLDAGYNQIDVAAPRNFVAAAGGNVCTAQLTYCLFPDRDATNSVVLKVGRSTDGGRNWQTPVTVYTLDTPGGEDLNTGDEGTHLFAYGDQVWVSLQTNAHNKVQAGQSLWVVGSADQGQTWSTPFNVSTGWNRPTGNKDWDVDLTRGAVGSLGLHLIWEADFENPAAPGTANAAPNNNENLYYAAVALSGSPASVVSLVPATTMTTFAMGTFDVDDPTIDVQDTKVLIAYVDDAHGGLAPGANCTLSQVSFDLGFTWSTPRVHAGLAAGTFALQWAQQRRAFALLDGPYAFVIQEDSCNDEDDVWMDRGDVDVVNSVVNWTVTGVRCNHTSVVPGSGDVDGMLVAAHDGVLAILYRDDSANTPLNNSNEAYLVVDRNYGNEFIAGTFQRHTVTPTTATIFDLDVVGNVIVGVYEGCSATDEEGGIVLSHDRGLTIDSHIFTALGGCSAGTIDVDDLKGAITQNGDYAVIYADERLGGAAGTNANNAAFVTGGKYPRLAYAPAAFQLTMDKIDPQQSGGGTAFLMISSQTSPGTDLNAYLGIAGAGRGHFVGLAADVFFGLMWANVLSFLTPINAAGTAQWSGIPNASALLGLPIHVAGGTLDWSMFPTDLFVSHTDPIVQ